MSMDAERLARRRRILRAVAPWVLTAAAIVAGNEVLHTIAVETLTRPMLELPNAPLQERTVGTNPRLVFDIYDAVHRSDNRSFFIIGDSSVGTGMMQPATMLPTFLEQELRKTYGAETRVVYLGYPGLLVEDALVFLAEALARKPDMVLYAVNPRIFADTSDERQKALGLGGRAARLTLAGAGFHRVPWSFFLRRFPAEKLAESWVSGRFHAVSDASVIRMAIHRRCEAERGSLARWLSYACSRLFPALDSLPETPPRKARLGYVYAVQNYEFEAGPTEAFSLVQNLCRSSGRCLLYRAPLNSKGRGCQLYFEPGLLERYEGFLSGSGFEAEGGTNHEEALDPEQFMNERAGGCDVLHPSEEGRRKLARLLAADVRAAITAREGEDTR